MDTQSRIIPIEGKTLEFPVEVSSLRPGDQHYMAYVGPPARYDFMGASQFRLLCTLGLRSNHTMLDFGCGSLRAGRFFISYLADGKYFGVEPNQWLIEEAIKNQIGQDMIRIKNPTFDFNNEFRVNQFSVMFDFILAQSIFSHTGINLIRKALRNFSEVLKDDGIIAVTFVEGHNDFLGTGWIYPGIVKYRRSTIRRFASEVGLFGARIPWFHPRQTWYLLAKQQVRLPNSRMLRHLSGAVLFDSEFKESYQKNRKVMLSMKDFVKRIISHIYTNTLCL